MKTPDLRDPDRRPGPAKGIALAKLAPHVAMQQQFFTRGSTNKTPNEMALLGEWWPAVDRKFAPVWAEPLYVVHMSGGTTRGFESSRVPLLVAAGTDWYVIDTSKASRHVAALVESILPALRVRGWLLKRLSEADMLRVAQFGRRGLDAPAT
jgi:hypothetical protein